MRLIDADKVLLNNFEVFMCDGNFKEALTLQLDKIDKAPTVEAIPIRYIEAKIKEHEPIPTAKAFCSSLNILLKLWEEENETNRCR